MAGDQEDFVSYTRRFLRALMDNFPGVLIIIVGLWVSVLLCILVKNTIFYGELTTSERIDRCIGKKTNHYTDAAKFVAVAKTCKELYK
jgi:hypothetical protein